MAGPNGYSHAETIQKLERLNQLETMTAEQRIRIEKYRTMYETLKAEQEQSDEVFSFSSLFHLELSMFLHQIVKLSNISF